MRKGENTQDDFSFNGVDGLKGPEFIQAVRNRAFGENKATDPQYMVILASLCLTGPALEWFEHQSDDVQNDWTVFRRALLARFSASGPAQEANHPQSRIFSGDNPKECEEFVTNVRKHSHSEGKSQDDQWTAHYAAGCMVGEALKWHAKLDGPIRNSWRLLERALLAYFPEPPPYGLTPAGRIVVESWSRMAEPPHFLPRNEDTWLREARQRRAAYDEAGSGGLASVHWLLVDGSGIPDTAIQTGVDTAGQPLYSARAWLSGGLHPGKCGRHLPGAHVPVGVREHIGIGTYEVLVGDASAVAWVGNPWMDPDAAGRNPAPIKMKPFHAIEGGIRDDGNPFLLAQGYTEGHGWQPGKMGLAWEHCKTGWGHKTFYQKDCRILTWA